MNSIRQAMSSKVFWICAAAFGLSVFLASVEAIAGAVQGLGEGGMLECGFHGYLVLEALSKNALLLALPILCALPYTASFVDDVKSGFIKEYLPRTTVADYLRGKIAACGLSGGLVLVLGLLFAYGLSALVFAPMEAPLAEGEEAVPYFVELIRVLPLFFCSGAFWSLVGMTFAAMTKSKYMAYASPFIFYYILIILNERYFPSFYILYPKEWLAPGEYWPLGNWGVVLLLLELIALISLAFWIAAKRRIERL